jgi:hypothetical protein
VVDSTIGVVLFAIVVIIGVALEGWEHLHDWRTKGMRPITPKIGFLVLVIGLAGETYFEKQAGHEEATFRNAAINDLRLEAKDLQQESQKAREAEDRLSESSWLLGETLVQRHLPIPIGPQGPSGTEFLKLKTFAGTKLIIVTAPDSEAILLSAEISAALRTAGWDEGDKAGRATILSLKQGYMLRGVHVTADLPHPEISTPLMKAAWALSQYLSWGYAKDWHMNLAANIDAEYMTIIAARPLPDWWPTDISCPPNTVCLFVGRRDFDKQIDMREAFERMPEKIRKWWFSSHARPWIQ